MRYSGAPTVPNSTRRPPSGRWVRFASAAMLACFALAPMVPMPVVSCPCDHAAPGTMSERVCSLCGTAEDADDAVYFLKDINPHKPSRYLALPKAHVRGYQSTHDLPAPLRAQLWQMAAERAEKLYPGRWGLAENSHFFRTQCHAHIHIGPLSPEVEDSLGTVYASAAEIPDVGAEQGIWMHPKGGGYCVHLDRDLAEIVLLR